MSDGRTSISRSSPSDALSDARTSLIADAARNVPVSEALYLSRPSEGYHVEWAPDARARPASAEEHATRKCRRPRCQGKPVMAFHRSNGWWLYCADHLYGRRITEGVVEIAHFAEDERV